MDSIQFSLQMPPYKAQIAQDRDQNAKYINFFNYLSNKIMTKAFRYLSKFLQAFDLFPTTQFLRYKQNGEYKTSTGGSISIAIIIIFIILFYRSGVETINQEIINSSMTYQIQVEPQPIHFQIPKAPDFMFSLGIEFLDLTNSSRKYFNISLRQHSYGPLMQGDNFTNIPLIPCTADHFSYNKDILEFYHKFYLSTNLCPPLNYDFKVGGRLISNVYQSLNIVIEYCNKTIDPMCASEAEVQALEDKHGIFLVYVPVIGTAVNAGDSKYKQVYLQERNYNFFTTKAGIWMNGQIQQYLIETDVSLLPVKSIQTETITTIPQLFITKQKTVFNGKYVEIVFDKSSKATTFTRSFNKIDDYFSYVGGLVGTVLLLFFILSSYSQKAYVINIASDIFDIERNSKGQCKKFNFFYFIAVNLKKGLEWVGLASNWQESGRFIKTAQQMQKQLSINYLLRRIDYFQEAISAILSQRQIKMLYLGDKKSIDQAKTQRRKRKRLANNKMHLKRQNELNLQRQQNNESKVSSAAFETINKQANLQAVKEQSQSSKESQLQPQMNYDFGDSLVEVIQQPKQGSRRSKRALQRVIKANYQQTQSYKVRPKHISQKAEQEQEEDYKQEHSVNQY